MANAVAEKGTTTLRVARETWARLNALRRDPADTTDDVLRRLLDERESAKAKAAD